MSRQVKCKTLQGEPDVRSFCSLSLGDLGDWSWIHHPQILTKFLFLPYKPRKGLHKQFERE